MSRTEYMRELDALLQGISKEEREEAMQYYNDYFDDADTKHSDSKSRGIKQLTKSVNPQQNPYGCGCNCCHPDRYC